MNTTTRNRTIALVGAIAVVVAVAVVVASLGVIRYPAVPTLEEQPRPEVPGRLAYIRWDEGTSCVRVVDARGEDREIRCDDALGSVRWVGDDRLAVEIHGGPDIHVETVDVRTGEVVAVDTGDDAGRDIEHTVWPAAEREDGAVAVTMARDGTAELQVVEPDGTRRTVWQADGPESYRFAAAGWSADGDWLLIRDSRQRTIVLRATGDPAPRLWITDAWEVAWSAAVSG